jgi:hypothetical protein
VLLWGSAKLKGLLTQPLHNATLAEILAWQRQDGGLSTSSLVGSWKRKDNTALEAESDGYATGVIAFALEQLDAPQTKPQLQESLDGWDESEQVRIVDGRLASLNKQREPRSDAGLFMRDSAMSYAVLALANARAW